MTTMPDRGSAPLDRESVGGQECFKVAFEGVKTVDRKTHDIGYDLPHHRTEYRKMSFFPHTTAEWNSLPREVVSATTLDSFEARLHPHL